MSAFSLMILEGISVSWHVLETSRFNISLNISSLATSKNEKAAFFYLHTAPMVSLLGCFIHFTISLIIESLILPGIGSLVTYSGILRLPTAFEKRYPKLELYLHHLKLSFSSSVIFSLDIILFERIGLFSRTFRYYYHFFIRVTRIMRTSWNVSKNGVFSGPYFLVFGLNTGKYGPETTPYLDTFHTLAILFFLILKHDSSFVLCTYLHFHRFYFLRFVFQA